MNRGTKMCRINGQIHSVIYSDYDADGDEFVEVRVRVKPGDISVEEIDLLRKEGKIQSYIIEGENTRGERFRELRIRYDPVDVKGYFQTGGLVVDFRPIVNKKLMAALEIDRDKRG